MVIVPPSTIPHSGHSPFTKHHLLSSHLLPLLPVEGLAEPACAVIVIPGLLWPGVTVTLVGGFLDEAQGFGHSVKSKMESVMLHVCVVSCR